MKNYLIDSRIRIVIYIMITFLFCTISPWWIISLIGTTIGFCANTKYNAIFESVISLSVIWFIMLINNLFIQEDKFIIVNKMKAFLGLNSITLIIVTLMIPILIGMIASLFGYELRKVISDEK